MIYATEEHSVARRMLETGFAEFMTLKLGSGL